MRSEASLQEMFPAQSGEGSIDEMSRFHQIKAGSPGNPMASPRPPDAPTPRRLGPDKGRSHKTYGIALTLLCVAICINPRRPPTSTPRPIAGGPSPNPVKQTQSHSSRPKNPQRRLGESRKEGSLVSEECRQSKVETNQTVETMSTQNERRNNQRRSLIE